MNADKSRLLQRRQSRSAGLLVSIAENHALTDLARQPMWIGERVPASRREFQRRAARAPGGVRGEKAARNAKRPFWRFRPRSAFGRQPLDAVEPHEPLPVALRPVDQIR